MFYLKLTLTFGLALAAWLAIVFITAFYGWWMSPVVSPGDADLFFEYSSNLLEAENSGNSALLLIEDGQITHEYYSSGADETNSDTAFSTASLSKWFAAYGVMQLVENGQIDLDAPVSDYLTRWELPRSDFNNDAVTTRRLLSHTAGLADGLGYGDYEAQEALPDLVSSLNAPRASSNREVSISVSNEPGTEWRYSGGGYLILELLVEEVTGQAFDEYMRETVFSPFGMNRSGYEFIDSYDNNAGSYETNGERATSYKYASRAATAFVTSPSDLSKFVLSQIPSSRYDASLGSNTLRDMREPHGRTSGIDIWGLGTILYSPSNNGDYVYGHDGANDPAINSTARINPDTGDAFLALVTGHPSLATNIGSQWVLWQTGYPDVLDSNAVIESMYLPVLIGVIILLMITLYFGFRHFSRRS